MALQDYISPSDITNKIFNKFPDITKQIYCDRANDELEDIAKRKGIDPVDISVPIHYKLKDYACHYAISQLAMDNIGFNSQDGYGGEDIYSDLFKREEYLLQSIKKVLTEVMFTGKAETPINRAVYAQRIFRG